VDEGDLVGFKKYEGWAAQGQVRLKKPSRRITSVYAEPYREKASKKKGGR